MQHSVCKGNIDAARSRYQLYDNRSTSTCGHVRFSLKFKICSGLPLCRSRAASSTTRGGGIRAEEDRGNRNSFNYLVNYFRQTWCTTVLTKYKVQRSDAVANRAVPKEAALVYDILHQIW